MGTKHYYKIGEVAKLTGLTADTLRYYEKFGLLDKVGRNESGLRRYTDKDLSSLRFIKRAQRINFSLAEIKTLLQMRKNPQHARNEVRLLTQQKLDTIESHLEELSTLKNELTLLLNLCRSTEGGCPIIEDIDTHDKHNSQEKIVKNK